MKRSMTRRGQEGMTLIEMMVAIVISMVMSLAVFGVMSSFEGQRRTIRSGADLDQVGSVAMFQLDQWIRSAGTGFTQASTYAYGCKLYATKSGTQLLPMSGTMPAPFASVVPGTAGAFRLVPALILPGQTTPGASGQASDVLVLMSSGNNDAAVPTDFLTNAGAATLNLVNNVAFTANDLVLIADKQPDVTTSGVASCLVTQAGTIGTTTPATVSLAGAWYASSVGTVSVSSYSGSARALDLGASPTTTAGGTPPSFQVVGVGDNNTLYSYDLLNLGGTQLQARGDNVFELHALYGVDTNGDGKVDSWVKADSGSYTAAALMDGSLAAATLIKNIRALRVGLILRTALPERDVVNADSAVTLFADLGTGLTFSRTLSGAELKYRYRTVEATIPLRNNSF